MDSWDPSPREGGAADPAGLAPSSPRANLSSFAEAGPGLRVPVSRRFFFRTLGLGAPASFRDTLHWPCPGPPPTVFFSLPRWCAVSRHGQRQGWGSPSQAAWAWAPQLCLRAATLPRPPGPARPVGPWGAAAQQRRWQPSWVHTRAQGWGAGPHRDFGASAGPSAAGTSLLEPAAPFLSAGEAGSRPPASPGPRGRLCGDTESRPLAVALSGLRTGSRGPEGPGGRGPTGRHGQQECPAWRGPMCLQPASLPEDRLGRLRG